MPHFVPDDLNTLLRRKDMILSTFDRLRLQRGAEHLHTLGPRAVAEFLAEIGTHHGCFDDVLARLGVWRRLSPEVVRIVGGDRFPHRMYEVPLPRERAPHEQPW
jgi:hypothetical protein